MNSQYAQRNGYQEVEHIQEKMDDHPRPGVLQPLRDEGDRQADGHIRNHRPRIEEDNKEHPPISQQGNTHEAGVREAGSDSGIEGGKRGWGSEERDSSNPALSKGQCQVAERRHEEPLCCYLAHPFVKRMVLLLIPSFFFLQL
jgi:hypothetical protein